MTAEADQSNIYGGFGAVIGYIGGEAATVEWFERLLWPQRFFSGFRLASAHSVALLLPMGGPLHKAALTALDKIYHHGLFKGAYRGNMLGTPFFRSQDWEYTMHGDDENETHTEPLRNCLWARALALLPIGERLVTKGPMDEERGTWPQSSRLRAHVAVNHLIISQPSEEDRNELPFVCEPSGTPSLRIYLGIITTEATALVLALVLAVGYRTTWSILFLSPLCLRLLSASTSIHREKLLSLRTTSAAADPPLDFEVHTAQSDGSFMLLTGPPIVVLQFMRHFGHPIRDRSRELAQIFCVAAMGLLYPFGLLCSMVWMPLEVQFVWLSYQIYLVGAMHIARYTQSGLGSTTEAHIAAALVAQDAKAKEPEKETSILFGHERHGEGTVKATWSATYHSRNAEGKIAMKALLRRRQSTPAAMEEKPTTKGSSKEHAEKSRLELPRSDSTDSDITLHGDDGDPDSPEPGTSKES